MKMKKDKQWFEQITHQQVLKMTKIRHGITNDNYKVMTNEGIYVLRIPKKEQIALDRENEENILKRIAKEDLDVTTLYFNAKTGIKITKWIPFIPFSLKKKKHVDLFFLQLKKLHSLEVKNIAPFAPFLRLKIFQNAHSFHPQFEYENKVLKHVQEIYQRYPLVLCHNDLLFYNLLVYKNQLYIIDYEYAGMNIALFDIVSFISENDIEDPSFYQEALCRYYGEVTTQLWHDFYWIYLFSDLLWSHWGYAMFEKLQKFIYLEIARQKEKRYHRFICYISNYL